MLFTMVLCQLGCIIFSSRSCPNFFHSKTSKLHVFRHVSLECFSCKRPQPLRQQHSSAIIYTVGPWADSSYHRANCYRTKIPPNNKNTEIRQEKKTIIIVLPDFFLGQNLYYSAILFSGLVLPSFLNCSDLAPKPLPTNSPCTFYGCQR